MQPKFQLTSRLQEVRSAVMELILLQSIPSMRSNCGVVKFNLRPILAFLLN